ncbi:UPF0158 family protein [Lewinella sp. W8]|uniref:UPF0158 family protein n=1 Tax=Lewinella sp. W8 TaxID=2528208 RepID=UPI0010680EB6|nr:UPF0158 family protein [Lewinella sp. W8]MTB51122.1 hypothetical protein [Lewinella sp. W8]
MELPDHQIKEIAEMLDSGTVCFINLKTKEVRHVIDPDSPYAEEEHWKEDLEENENNWEEYIKIHQMSSRDSFKIMEAFAATVEDPEIQRRLRYALNNRKPFRNFKYEVDYDDDVRQRWFRFKASKIEAWVRDYLRLEIGRNE